MLSLSPICFSCGSDHKPPMQSMRGLQPRGPRAHVPRGSLPGLWKVGEGQTPYRPSSKTRSELLSTRGGATFTAEWFPRSCRRVLETAESLNVNLTGSEGPSVSQMLRRLHQVCGYLHLRSFSVKHRPDADPVRNRGEPTSETSRVGLFFPSATAARISQRPS